MRDASRDEYGGDGFIGDSTGLTAGARKALRQIRAPSEPLDLAASLRCALVNSSIIAISANFPHCN
jgi:hypothetical protein